MPPSDPASLYIDLLKQCLTRSIFGGVSHMPLAKLGIPKTDDLLANPRVRQWIKSGDAEVVWRRRNSRVEAELRGYCDPQARGEGRDWPFDAESMIGLRRMENIESCVRDVLARGVPGDLVETGVWRGGAVIFMRGLLEVLSDVSGVSSGGLRRVWACDSFEGLPKPNAEQYPADRKYDFTMFEELSVSLDQVRANFARYGLLDDRVCFLRGWFKDTLPTAPIEKIAVLRLDGDLYESTMDALTALYAKVSEGGYVIVDDYNDIPACKQAVDEFRANNSISDEIHSIDWTGVYWKRGGSPFGPVATLGREQ